VLWWLTLASKPASAMGAAGVSCRRSDRVSAGSPARVVRGVLAGGWCGAATVEAVASVCGRARAAGKRDEALNVPDDAVVGLAFEGVGRDFVWTTSTASMERRSGAVYVRVQRRALRKSQARQRQCRELQSNTAGDVQYTGSHARLNAPVGTGPFNGAVVRYTTSDGKRQTVGPLDSGCDDETLKLMDRSPTNPVNAHGIPRRWLLLDLEAPASLVAAVEMGSVALVETNKVAGTS
jgi:hypothetical protein